MPTLVEAKGYERHVDLKWKSSPDPTVAQFVIYRSMNGEPFRAIGVQRYGVNRFCDYLGNPHATASYKISARSSSLRESPLSKAVTASTHPMSDDELLTMVQAASFRYYWEANEPNSGMTRESAPGADDVIAVGASGFGIMSMVVGAERGFFPREEVVNRMLRITNFLAKADQYHGAWPHFLSGRTGHTISVFGIYDDGADLVETSFLMQGLLSARQYFHQDNEKERQLRDNITELWKSVDWDWFRATPNKDALYWHWSPDYAFHIANRLEGWNEVTITYMLAIASPTHASPASIYHTGYTDEGDPQHSYGLPKTYYGITVNMDYTPDSPGPLFFTDYSYLGYDPHGWRDKYANYFDNNRNESLVSQAYSVANPRHFKYYGADVTQSPFSKVSHELPCLSTFITVVARTINGMRWRSALRCTLRRRHSQTRLLWPLPRTDSIWCRSLGSEPSLPGKSASSDRSAKQSALYRRSGAITPVRSGGPVINRSG